ncbi:unnamed protein product [Mytilus edulis]|uniref:Uncharacterized protein n=1 Tax=Mytilus edulis TaxID=6550 RepID=A0A8S3QS95_MYTED|nr:unnamed protein product [Mytilus edulis]
MTREQCILKILWINNIEMSIFQTYTFFGVSCIILQVYDEETRSESELPITGIIIGSLMGFVIILIAAVVFLLKLKKNRRRKKKIFISKRS